jgi:hypothetical protein
LDSLTSKTYKADPYLMGSKFKLWVNCGINLLILILALGIAFRHNQGKRLFFFPLLQLPKPTKAQKG